MTLDYDFNNETDDISTSKTLIKGVHTVSAEYNGEKTIIYVDGSIVGESNEAYPSVILFDELTIGATEMNIDANVASGGSETGTLQYTYGYNKFLTSDVYSVRIYNRALTDTEINQNYIIDNIRFCSGR